MIPGITLKSNEIKRTGFSVCGCAISFALPLLLFLQFGVAFQVHDKSTEDLELPMVNFAIALFTATAWFYRKSFTDSHIRSYAFHLLPEATVMGVIALNFYHQLTFGFLVMIYGMFLMALSVVVRSVCLLLYTSEHNNVDATLSSTESQEVDILVV
jgi:hypothetical protein